MSHFSLRNMLNKIFNLFRVKNQITTKARKRVIEHTQFILGHRIKNENYFIEAFTHKSYSDLKKNIQSNQRLEFLGDAVLDLVVADILFKKYPLETEGNLTKYRARIVNKYFLYEIALGLNFQEYIFINKNLLSSSNFSLENILPDALEAFIGAVYLDLGYKIVYDFVLHKILFKAFENNIHLIDTDYKSRLLEIINSRKLPMPQYETYEHLDADNQKYFEVYLYIGNKKYGNGIGKSKKIAQQNAAKEAIQLLNKEK
ncbi:MAG TPA: ribonuclease III [Ignavibacteriales bacterium]|nr:ribonuclease III [Ignavibacteriales bacterium]HOL81603.1 ribonuclease III [Ignavibacteriales bacterium]HOM65567.1 ribonuclease III [Ignavibacteriales bacterium]HPD67870.1 ribonuclease III [Ignavibacteriales bacterium]HPP33717.1 ribonuclease III [Ignavibacteriales bacterium]